MVLAEMAAYMLSEFKGGGKGCVSAGLGHAGDGRWWGLSRPITPAGTLQLARAMFNLICAA